MNDELLNWLLKNYGQEKMRPGLARITLALTPLLPELKKIRTVTIAGTNGKGETTLRLAHNLRKHSYCCWISPHIERITERFISQDGEISLERLKGLVESCHKKVQENNFELSFYEFLFFVFCTWATEERPEFLLLEVGLGGRLDAVNVLDAELVLLPSISRDHQEFLGPRYDQILLEKIAVARPYKKLISFFDLNYLRERAGKWAKKMKVEYVDLEQYSQLSGFEFSRRNELLARAAFLAIEAREINQSSLDFLSDGDGFLENRGEVITRDCEWIFFGSHNADGVRKLIQFLHSANYNFSRPPYESVIVAFSQRDPVDLRAMMKMIKSSCLGKIVVTHFDHPKAAAKDVIQDLCHQEGLDFVQDAKKYVQGRNKDSVLVTGSYYFLGHIKSFLRKQ